jgi:aldose 1-epimerase
MKIVTLASLMLLAIALPAEAAISVQAWGGVDAKGVDLFTLTNARGMEAKITNYGAVITSIRVPGRDGKVVNVVQGFDRLEDYTSPDYHGRYGAIIGRFANRIKDNTYQINRVIYRVAGAASILKKAKKKP